MERSHTLGEISEKLKGKKVRIAGWIDAIREHGKIAFIDLRDRYGKVQAVISQKSSEFEKLKDLSMEACIAIEGKVNERPKGTENKDINTGKVEIAIEKIDVFNLCPPLPFELSKKSLGEEIRLKYRFLDLRRESMQANIIFRHKLIKAIRDFLDKEEFLEIETPLLAKSTPEGARDFLVPSRMHPGKFYALPQSPQLFKQLLMVGGFDKYFQIARCMRDEDLRSDRQPEFTQLDMEMSFINQEDLISLIEKMIKYVFKETKEIDIKIPFTRIMYDEAMKKYGKDSPDLRKNSNDPNELAFCWVLNFPAFEYSQEEKKYVSVHHPFTMPNLEEFKKNPEKAHSLAYDLVLNGVEIGGGSIRIHNPEIQKQVFKFLGIGDKEAKEKFGFLLDALKFGAPPHGGIAFGIDRIVQILQGEESIREGIAFPKNKEARDLMLNAPAEVAKRQLDEINISVNKEKKAKKSKK